MWNEPKTDWKSGDAVMWTDYNRIKNNIEYLKQRAEDLCGPVTNYQTMGIDKTYTDFYYADEFNAFENNIAQINSVVYPQDIGAKQTFYDNGAFISSAEMNRLETACQLIKDALDSIKPRRIPFKLGTYKDIRI